MTLSADGSTFYGTTQTGGSYNAGTVFSVPVGGGTPTTLAVFNGSNGFQPLGALTLLGSTLYGTTDDGGANRAGAVFSVPVTGGTPTDLASFDTTTGNTPEAGLTLSADGKTFYGTTYNGGLINGGTVFSVPVAGGALTTLASFNGTDGLFPAAGLTLSADGKTLYGTTQGGGNGSGTVFSVPVTGGTPTSLVIFNGTNGSVPSADLTLLGGALYGTTAEGGVNNDGTAFSVPVGGGSPTTLVSFSGTNGIFPDSSLMFSGSTLYGTTAQGGAFGDGTVFSLTPNAAPIPEASSLVSFGLLLLGGLSAAALRARRKSGAV